MFGLTLLSFIPQCYILKNHTHRKLHSESFRHSVLTTQAIEFIRRGMETDEPILRHMLIQKLSTKKTNPGSQPHSCHLGALPVDNLLQILLMSKENSVGVGAGIVSLYKEANWARPVDTSGGQKQGYCNEISYSHREGMLKLWA